MEVVAAVIEFGGRMLFVKRGLSKYSYLTEKLEFPRGKPEEEETEQYAMKFMVIEHSYLYFHLKKHVFKS